MFDLKRPCVNCPFRKGQGRLFRMPRLRLKEIFSAIAFQCHKTVNYDEWDDPEKRSGDHPQQCAGLMSILYREGKTNTIMQVAIRSGHLDPTKLDHSEVYHSIATAMAAHGHAARLAPEKPVSATGLPRGSRKHADSLPLAKSPPSRPNRGRGLPRATMP